MRSQFPAAAAQSLDHRCDNRRRSTGNVARASGIGVSPGSNSPAATFASRIRALPNRLPTVNAVSYGQFECAQRELLQQWTIMNRGIASIKPNERGAAPRRGRVLNTAGKACGMTLTHEDARTNDS